MFPRHYLLAVTEHLQQVFNIFKLLLCHSDVVLHVGFLFLQTVNAFLWEKTWKMKISI